jgi:hypothetical protein
MAWSTLERLMQAPSDPISPTSRCSLAAVFPWPARQIFVPREIRGQNAVERFEHQTGRVSNRQRSHWIGCPSRPTEHLQPHAARERTTRLIGLFGQICAHSGTVEVPAIFGAVLVANQNEEIPAVARVLSLRRALWRRVTHVTNATSSRIRDCLVWPSRNQINLTLHRHPDAVVGISVAHTNGAGGIIVPLKLSKSTIARRLDTRRYISTLIR